MMMMSQSRSNYIHLSIISNQYQDFLEDAKKNILLLHKNSPGKMIMYGIGFWSGRLASDLNKFCIDNGIESSIAGHTSSAILGNIHNFVIMLDNLDSLAYLYQKYIKYGNNENIRIVILKENKSDNNI